jgi:hypothetical protein
LQWFYLQHYLHLELQNQRLKLRPRFEF